MTAKLIDDTGDNAEISSTFFSLRRPAFLTHVNAQTVLSGIEVTAPGG